MTLINPGRIGRAVLGTTDYWRGFHELLFFGLRRLGALGKPPVRRVLLKQIYFTGIEALGAVTVIAALSGIVITTQITSLVGQNIELTAKIMLWTVVRELGPLLSAIVIIARSSSATASELASMKIRGEINHLRFMGISPGDYLVVPRIAGITLSIIAVTFYFQMTAIVIGYAFAGVMGFMPFMKSLSGVIATLSLTEVLVSFFKALVFGLVISITSSYYGLRATGTVTAIPRAATRAVMRNMLVVFLLNGIISYVFFV
ncbi:MAG: ABC transporter permease [Gammaproteobacteria bacterium]|nr:ABC transporter permease [Gammaproteobacteria bacterium]